MRKRIFSLLLAFVLIFSMAGCAGKNKKTQNMIFSSAEREISYVTSEADTSDFVTLSEDSADKIQNYIAKQKTEYVYSDLYNVEECYKRIFTKVNVKKHKEAVLDPDTQLGVSQFVEVVQSNNKAYFEENPQDDVFYKELEEEYLRQICQLILDTVNCVLKDNPKIDKERVYCNLGNLTIFYKSGMVDNAHVTGDLMLNISESMFELIGIMKGDNAGRNVIMHETMHIIQMGCKCENIKHCKRRCGISIFWDDFPLNTADWGWFFEGSAERMVGNITGEDPVTYEYMINYLCSVSMALLNRDDVEAGYLETISFYDDPELLFTLFDCEEKEDYIEIIKLMTTINVLQMQPADILEAYAETYDKPIEEQEDKDEFNRTIKPDICMTLTKHFYKNLTTLLATRKDVTLNDVCYMIHLFETMIGYHLSYYSEEYQVYNSKFMEFYKGIRGAFFKQIKKSNSKINIEAYYSNYDMILSDTEEQKVINAGLKWCDVDKVEFMLERMEYSGEYQRAKVE